MYKEYRKSGWKWKGLLQKQHHLLVAAHGGNIQDLGCTGFSRSARRLVWRSVGLGSRPCCHWGHSTGPIQLMAVDQFERPGRGCTTILPFATPSRGRNPATGPLTFLNSQEAARGTQIGKRACLIKDTRKANPRIIAKIISQSREPA